MRRGEGDPAIAVVIGVLFVASAVVVVGGAEGGELTTQLLNGFTATHAAGAAAAFEPVLYATNGVFAFGFLRVGSASLDLAVVHLPSSFPLWRATPARLGDWSRPATLTFDSNLVLTDEDDGVLWQTLDTIGDTVVLLNSSNLVLRRYAEPLPAWQSFDSPSDTLVLDQNFTVSSPPLISNNRRFAFRLGTTYMVLHMEFYGGRTTPVYWQHTALEAQPQNATEPPVYGRLDARGFFGLYLEGGGQKVDVLSFDTFVQNLTGVFRRMTLDDDGNLRAYYWTDGAKDWISDYKAIAERCELPTSCGAYGLCVPGNAQCQCLDNSTGTSPPCHAESPRRPPTSAPPPPPTGSSWSSTWCGGSACPWRTRRSCRRRRTGRRRSARWRARATAAAGARCTTARAATATSSTSPWRRWCTRPTTGRWATSRSGGCRARSGRACRRASPPRRRCCRWFWWA